MPDDFQDSTDFHGKPLRFSRLVHPPGYIFTSSTLVKKPSKFVKGDEAKKIIESMYKLDSPFVRYALSSSYRSSYNVYYPRSALNASYNNVVQNTGIV